MFYFTHKLYGLLGDNVLRACSGGEAARLGVEGIFSGGADGVNTEESSATEPRSGAHNNGNVVGAWKEEAGAEPKVLLVSSTALGIGAIGSAIDLLEILRVRLESRVLRELNVCAENGLAIIVDCKVVIGAEAADQIELYDLAVPDHEGPVSTGSGTTVGE